MSSKSLTQRSVEYIKKQGYPLVQVVEYYNAFTRRRHDLFGIIDILAVSDKDILMVQTTSRSNMSSRIRKIEDSQAIDILRKAGFTIEVHGWSKNSKGRYVLKVTDVS